MLQACKILVETHTHTNTQRNYGCQATTQYERRAQFFFPSVSAVVITACEVTALQVSRNIRINPATSDWSSTSETDNAANYNRMRLLPDLRLLMCKLLPGLVGNFSADSTADLPALTSFCLFCFMQIKLWQTQPLWFCPSWGFSHSLLLGSNNHSLPVVLPFACVNATRAPHGPPETVEASQTRSPTPLFFISDSFHLHQTCRDQRATSPPHGEPHENSAATEIQSD